MKEETKKITVYTVGGKEFTNKKEAEKYEKEINKELNYTFFVVIYNPDLTEGRGYYKAVKLAVPKIQFFDNPKLIAMNYCVENFGKPVEYVQGCSPIQNYIINKGRKFETIEELEQFKQEKISIGVGDYKKLKNIPLIYLDEKGSVIHKED
ncbi:MAG: hypothetical protein ACOCUI_04800 [bacterium]